MIDHSLHDRHKTGYLCSIIAIIGGITNNVYDGQQTPPKPRKQPAEDEQHGCYAVTGVKIFNTVNPLRFTASVLFNLYLSRSFHHVSLFQFVLPAYPAAIYYMNWKGTDENLVITKKCDYACSKGLYLAQLLRVTYQQINVAFRRQRCQVQAGKSFAWPQAHRARQPTCPKMFPFGTSDGWAR